MSSLTKQSYINISGYRFIAIPEAELIAMREHLLEKTREMGLKGTILLGAEGVNIFVSAERSVIEQFSSLLASYAYFEDMRFKESVSEEVPYKRMLVKIKDEIIPMGHDEIVPHDFTAPHLAPDTLKQWYQEGKDMIILDTRNEYETQLGVFKDAVELDIRNFRQFPAALESLSPEMKNKTVVTYCTGGIRCEKAAALMSNLGFKDVYQLDGGILNYFEQCGGDFFEGECFVFDKRIAVDASLNETNTIQCYACRGPVTEKNQPAGVCPYCGDDNIADRV